MESRPVTRKKTAATRTKTDRVAEEEGQAGDVDRTPKDKSLIVEPRQVVEAFRKGGPRGTEMEGLYREGIGSLDEGYAMSYRAK